MRRMCELSEGSGSFCDPDRNRSQRSETLQALGGRTRLQPLLYPDRLSFFSSLRVLLASKDAPSSVLPIHTLSIHSFMCASNSAPSKKKEWANRLESRILMIHVCVARSRIASGTIGRLAHFFRDDRVVPAFPTPGFPLVLRPRYWLRACPAMAPTAQNSKRG